MLGIGWMDDTSFWVIDTGGLDADDRTLAPLLAKQVEHALADADAVLFIVDGREGVTATDRDIAQRLRSFTGPVYVAVNKIEGLDGATLGAEFFELGMARPPHAISAKNGDGVRILIESMLAETAGRAEDPAMSPAVPHFAVVGRPNVGKSTLVNRIVGEDRMIVSDLPGTTRDSVRVPIQHDGENFVLVDTAGVRRRSRTVDRIERFSVVKTLRSLDEVQVVILVVDAQAGISEQDARLAGIVEDTGRAIVLVVNKWDGLTPNARRRVKLDLDRKLPCSKWVPVLYCSAKFGSAVGDVMPAVRRVYASAMAELATPQLNTVLRDAVALRSPPRVGRRQIKLKYAHQGGRNPPQVIVHGSMVDRVPATYRRFLANCVREHFGLVGTPVWITFKAQDNPYAGRGRRRRSAARR